MSQICHAPEILKPANSADEPTAVNTLNPNLRIGGEELHLSLYPLETGIESLETPCHAAPALQVELRCSFARGWRSARPLLRSMPRGGSREPAVSELLNFSSE